MVLVAGCVLYWFGFVLVSGLLGVCFVVWCFLVLVFGVLICWRDVDVASAGVVVLFSALACSGFRLRGAFLRVYLLVSDGLVVLWFGGGCVFCGCCVISFLGGYFGFGF